MFENRFNRRHFFYGSLLAGIVPSRGLGAPGALPASGNKSFNDKLNVALIGLGLRGPQIVTGAAASENIVALCDVDDERGAATSKTYSKATRYKDFRVMLDKEGKNIDAVMIAVPDHWHTPLALYCMQHGKHVYVEKPLTRTPTEARMLADAAAKYKVVTQMGNQGFSHEGTKTACEIVWSGDIGDVREVHAWTGGVSGGKLNIPATGPAGEPVPGTLDWDLWLGPAAARPFNPMYNSHWRAFQDFSAGGSLGDWLVHILGPAHLALQLATVSPISVETVSIEGKNQWEWPWRAHTVFEFPARGSMPPVTIHLYQNMRGDFQYPSGMAENENLFPPMNNLAEKGRPSLTDDAGTILAELTADGKPAPGVRLPGQFGGGRGGRAGGPGGRAAAPPDPQRGPGNGSVFVGSKGVMATSQRGEGVWLLPASRWAEYKLPPQLLPRGVNHQQDWIRGCKGGAAPVSQFSVASKYIEWLVLGTIALRVPGKLVWDAKNLRFSNSEEANKLLVPSVRKAWDFKV
jgi:predicted dehydrogenase